MVAMERAFERVKQFALNDWQTLADHVDLDPIHETLMLREHLTEVACAEYLSSEPAGFLELLENCESAARELEAELVAVRAADESPPRLENADRLFQEIARGCVACHQTYRDAPRTPPAKFGRSVTASP